MSDESVWLQPTVAADEQPVCALGRDRRCAVFDRAHRTVVIEPPPLFDE